MLVTALELGALAAYFYNSMNITVYNVDLAISRTLYRGQIIHTTIAGSSVDIRVANNKASGLSSFALGRGICPNKNLSNYALMSLFEMCYTLSLTP